MVTNARDLDWNNLGFNYYQLPYRYQAEYHNGQWQKGYLTDDPNITLSEASEEFHYGQEIFEGLKAYRTKDGHINLFRPEENAKRLNNSAKRMLMKPFPTDWFLEACKEVVLANEEYLPPYESGGTLYLRPFMIGTTPVVKVVPADDFIFRIYATPVGAYAQGLKPLPYTVSRYDRAAAFGTGQVKTAGNYAGSLLPEMEAKQAGFADCLYLDPQEHKYIDEFSGANFFAITKEGQFLTPQSNSILPSITKKSLLQIAKDLDLHPVEEKMAIDEVIDNIAEAGAIGTAAVISPVGSLTYKNKKYVFHSETEAGPVTKVLYDRLHSVQRGDLLDDYNWNWQIK